MDWIILGVLVVNLCWGILSIAYGLDRIESKLNKLISMQGWDELADEAERKDGEVKNAHNHRD